jgi:hypothetical protein
MLEATLSSETIFSSEVLFLKKHNREAIARSISKKPSFETEEEELEWMFPSLPSDIENSQFEDLKSRVQALDDVVHSQGEQITRLEGVVASLSQTNRSPSRQRNRSTGI